MPTIAETLRARWKPSYATRVTNGSHAFETALCLVEWPERLGPYRPRGALSLCFALAPGDSRQVELRVDGDNWTERLEDLA